MVKTVFSFQFSVFSCWLQQPDTESYKKLNMKANAKEEQKGQKDKWINTEN
jgi:hypothetical protein